MIQRIQTLYLLAVVALGIALIFLPVLQLVTPEEAAELQIYELSAVGGAPLQGLWGLLLTTILIPALLRRTGDLCMAGKAGVGRGVAHPSLGIVPVDLYGVNPDGYASHPQGRSARPCSR